MLRRINLHLEENQISELDEIAGLLAERAAGTNHTPPITRADLVRFAICRVYGLPYKHVHISKESLWDMIRLVKRGLPE